MKDDALTLKFYRHSVRYQVWSTFGQVKAMTMVYQDLFKVRSPEGKTKVCNQVTELHICEEPQQMKF